MFPEIRVNGTGFIQKGTDGGIDLPTEVSVLIGALGPPMSVKTHPGWIATHLIPSGRRSTDRLLEIMFIVAWFMGKDRQFAEHKHGMMAAVINKGLSSHTLVQSLPYSCGRHSDLHCCYPQSNPLVM